MQYFWKVSFLQRPAIPSSKLRENDIVLRIFPSKASSSSLELPIHQYGIGERLTTSPFLLPLKIEKSYTFTKFIRNKNKTKKDNCNLNKVYHLLIFNLLVKKNQANLSSPSQMKHREGEEGRRDKLWPRASSTGESR